MKQQINRHELELLDGLAATAVAQRVALKATINNIRALLLVDVVADGRKRKLIDDFVLNGSVSGQGLVRALGIEVDDPLVPRALRDSG